MMYSTLFIAIFMFGSFTLLHYVITKLILVIKNVNIIKKKKISDFIYNFIIKTYKKLSKIKSASYIFISLVIWFIPLKYNENALLGFTGLTAILEGTLSDKKRFKKKATLNIIYITILYIMISLISDYIQYEPLYKQIDDKDFFHKYDSIFSLIRAHLLAILYIKAFKIAVFLIKDKENI
ncbi:hypothetical protein [Fusobacterium pseudoperiodonticum]|uniref:hypothetical protein n=1 Tax=Fusobacterium pseudoperiodonticum TaxID=2663009 RepID=UPI000C1C4732|nr:hypothetical protein [Fusobacterium pseudoperiodonticum]ATV63737.1 hypothetical protein CTM78_04580 [Fusobacterium pseudoperiodonticum]